MECRASGFHEASHTADLSPESHSHLGTHRQIWILSSSTKHPIHNRRFLLPTLQEEMALNSLQATKRCIYCSVPRNFGSSQCSPRVTINFPEDPQPHETGQEKRQAIHLRSQNAEISLCCQGMHPSNRTGRMVIRNSQRRKRTGQEIIKTTQTATKKRQIQLARLLHISRVLFSPCLIKKKPIQKEKKISDSHHILGWLIGSCVDAGSQQLTAKLEFSLSFSFLRSNLWYSCSLFEEGKDHTKQTSNIQTLTHVPSSKQTRLSPQAHELWS